jgi:hypothetical protein
MALACFPEVDMATALAFADSTDRLIVCDSVRKKGYDIYGAPDPLKYSLIERTVDLLTAPIRETITFVPHLSCDILDDMHNIALSLSELCGCAVDIHVDGTLKRKNGQRYAADVDIQLYCATLVHLLLLARQFSLDRSAQISLSSVEESPLVNVSFLPITAHNGNKNNTDRFAFTRELFAIRSIFQRVNTLFSVSPTGERFSVTFTPLRPDWSLLGIKKPNGELIFDVDPYSFDGQKNG